jgi:hypothetical protein
MFVPPTKINIESIFTMLGLCPMEWHCFENFFQNLYKLFSVGN